VEFSFRSNITVIEAPVDDIWMRDIAPTFALRGSGREQEVVAEIVGECVELKANGVGGE
jgi:agmatine/peptidylarginine deiminase